MKTRQLRPGEKTFAYVMLLFSLFLFYQAYKIAGFSGVSSAGATPMAAAAVMAGAALSILLWNRPMQPLEAATRKEALRRFLTEVAPRHPWFGYVLIIFAYMAAIEPLGFNLSSFLFLFISFWYLHRKGLLFTLGLSFLTVGIIYVTFQLIFRVILPEGDWLELLVSRFGG